MLIALEPRAGGGHQIVSPTDFFASVENIDAANDIIWINRKAYRVSSLVLNSDNGEGGSTIIPSLEDARSEDNVLAGNIDFDGNTAINLANPVNGGDAVNLTYLTGATWLTDNMVNDALGYVPLDQDNYNVAGGYPLLDVDGLIPASLLPPLSITNTFVRASEIAMLALTAEQGDVCVRTDESKSYILAAADASDIDNWVELLAPTSAAGGGSVLTVNGQTGNVNLTASDINGIAAAARNAISATSPIAYSSVTGVISLGTVPIANGGVGFTTYAKGDIMYASAVNTLAKLPIGAQGEVLTVGANNTIKWGDAAANATLTLGQTVNNTGNVSGILVAHSASGNPPFTLQYLPGVSFSVYSAINTILYSKHALYYLTNGFGSDSYKIKFFQGQNGTEQWSEIFATSTSVGPQTYPGVVKFRTAENPTGIVSSFDFARRTGTIASGTEQLYFTIASDAPAATPYFRFNTNHVGMLFKDVAAVPSGNPTAGVYLFSSGGNLYQKKSNGFTTMIS